MARVRAYTVALALLLVSPARAAEHGFPEAPQAPPVEPRLSFSLSTRAGLVEAPFVTTAFPQVSGFASVTTPSAALRLPSLGWLRARLPLSYVRLDFPAGAQVGEVAIGNLELALEHGRWVRPSTRLAALASLLAPTADSGPEESLLNSRALALGSALRGGRDSFLLMPGIAGFRLGASIEQTRLPFQFRVSLDLPFLIRVSDAGLADDTDTRALGVLATLDVRAAWWLSAWCAASVGVALVTEPLRVQEPVRDADRSQRLQPIVEPGVDFRLGHHVRLALQGSVPLGGTLGGEAWSIAPSIRADW